MNEFSKIVNLLFLISSALFGINVFAWILMLLREFLVAKWLFDLLIQITGGTIALFGLLAGLLGSISLIIWILALVSGRNKEIEFKYVFIPILYGIVWIVFVFGKMMTGTI